jgi:hypothetical protein
VGDGRAVAGGIAAAAWLVIVVVLAVATRPRRPRPAPAGGPAPAQTEPPAVAALLAGGCRLGRPALAGTLLDLAARGWYRIVPGDGGLRCVAAAAPTGVPSGLLPAYEQVELAHVHVRLAATGDAPPSALAAGQSTGADDGWARFRAGVIAEAGRLGLVRRRVGRTTTWLLRTAAAVPGVLVFLAIHAARPGGAGVAAGLFFGYVTFGALGFPVLGVLRGVRPTRAGAAAGAQWRGLAATLRQDPLLSGGSPATLLTAPGGGRPADRRVAYAVALGAAPGLAAVFAPPEPGTVWSSYGGRWRLVRRGDATERVVTNPALVVLVGVWAVLFVAGMVAFAQFSRTVYAPLIVLGAVAVAAGGVLLTTRALLRNLRRPTSLTVDGQVVDSWLVTGDSDSPDRHCLAIDDGHTDPAWSLQVTPAVRARFHIGDQVRLRVDARRNRLLELTPVTPGVRARPPEP